MNDLSLAQRVENLTVGRNACNCGERLATNSLGHLCGSRCLSNLGCVGRLRSDREECDCLKVASGFFQREPQLMRMVAFLTTSLLVTALTTMLRAGGARFRAFVDQATDSSWLTMTGPFLTTGLHGARLQQKRIDQQTQRRFRHRTRRRVHPATEAARVDHFRKRAKDGLRESEARFRTLVQFSFDVYWETDAQHRIIRQEFC